MALNKAQLMASPNGADSISGAVGAVKAGNGIAISSDGTISSTVDVGVSQLIAGTNITLTPSTGVGAVTISSNVGVGRLIAGTGISLSPSTGIGDVTISTSGATGDYLRLVSPTVQTVNSEVDFVGNSSTNNPTISVVGVSPTGFAPAFTSFKTSSFTEKLVNISYSASSNSGFVSVFGASRLMQMQATGSRGDITLADTNGNVLTSLTFDTDNLYGESYIANKLGPTGNVGAWFRAFDGTTLYGWWGRRADGLQGLVLSQSGVTDTQDFAATTSAAALSTATSEAYVETAQTKIARINASGCQGLSDLSMKTNVSPLPYGLSEVLQLDPIQFQYDFNGDLLVKFPGPNTTQIYTNEENASILGCELSGSYIAPGTTVLSIDTYPCSFDTNQDGYTQEYAYILNLSQPTTYSGTGEEIEIQWSWLSDMKGGFGAQDVQLQIPEAIDTTNFQGVNYLYMDYNALTATLTNAVKELATQLTDLQTAFDNYVATHP